MASGRVLIAIGLGCSVFAAICAISSGSLWIDEFGTWLLTRANSLDEWWTRLQSWPDSDSQIPLYHFFMYVWTALVGTDAFAMRASNIGMFAIANIALLWPFRSNRAIAIPLILTLCLSSPVWYYLNEIRPYIMLYMGICLMFGATIELLHGDRQPSASTIAVLCVGAVISSGASVLGVAWAASVAFFILVDWLEIKKRPLRTLLAKHYLTLAITVICVAALLAHDVRMFALGKRPALLYESNTLTFVFSFYANAGLLGVGPGMLDLRAAATSALIPFMPIIAISAILLTAIAIGGLVQLRAIISARTLALLLACVFIPVLFTFILGLLLHWRVVARHLIPLAPLFSLLYALGIAWWWQRRSLGKTIALSSIVVMGYSSLSIRFAPRHAKDDYKHAAGLALAELARGGRVWWSADARGLIYYDVPFVSDPSEPQKTNHDGKVKIADDRTFPILSGEEAPSLVLLSKPDAYDQQNEVGNYLSTHNYRITESFPAFTAWRR